MTRGGYRQNAGRKQGFSAKSAEEARQVLSEMVMREIGPIGEALITKAKGGDVSATKELFDRAFGKPQQNIDINQNEDYRKEVERISEQYASLIEEIKTSGSNTDHIDIPTYTLTETPYK